MFRYLPLAAITLCLLLAGPWVALLSSRSEAAPGALVLAVVPPWRDVEAAITEAGGRLVGPTRAPWAVLTTSEAPNFAGALRRNGAWMLLNPDRLREICGYAV